MDAAGWNERYAKGQVWSTEPNRFFVDAVRRHGLDTPSPGQRAIDLGCGEGRNALWLAELGWSTTAVDFSSVAIERVAIGAGHRGVAVAGVVADLESYELGSRSWDLVAVVYVHWPSEIRLPWIRRVADAVAHGGALVIIGHDRTNITKGHGGPQNPDVLTTPDEQAADLRAAGLDVVEARELLRSVTLEPGHGSPLPASAGQGSTTIAAETPVLADAIDHVIVARRR